jgi:hypothetical protein
VNLSTLNGGFRDGASFEKSCGPEPFVYTQPIHH